ncbi:uncharacterized protein SOCEGT47_040310 [Sorangium cellulosum]|uniref:tRNA pseudouridine synthase B n=1 Tax=Sorangium cellulosum TaxID=56 RepID=A0A4P2Q2K6_SORCE|nr:tRNA pseudouridine(55) synthase TruB [Sorangium cellulosum]AUX23504.1 uncharacterized protein SOCEGT47_040310 [Sorangium cellulosum]
MKRAALSDPPPKSEHPTRPGHRPASERPAGPGPRRDGVLVIDKPSGPTSHDVVARLRRALGVKRIGHAGTLDPMASGVLVVLVGEATKLAPYLTAQDKRYTARVVLGVGTDTLDANGEVTATRALPRWLDEELDALARAGGPLGGDAGEALARAAPRLAAALDAERARRAQTPPAYSAIKVAGQRSYALARAGQAVDLSARAVEVRSLGLTGASGGGPAALAGASGGGPAALAGASGGGPAALAGAPGGGPAALAGAPGGGPAALAGAPAPGSATATLELDLAVSKGYYVRSLARDLGAHLEVPAHLSALRRTASGSFTLDQAVALDAGVDALRAALRPLAEAASSSLPVAFLTEHGARRARLGQALTESDFTVVPTHPGASVWLAPDGQVVALGAPELGEDVAERPLSLATARFSVLRGFTGVANDGEIPER